MNTGQMIYNLRLFVSEWTVNLTIQIDTKDNKYRYRIFNIRKTLTGKDETSPFARYIVNVTAETDNSIVSGEGKYSKGQRKAAQKDIILIDGFINEIIKSLNAAIDKKPEDF
jgi:hypothetical protein